jgi:hypothetical protein
MFPLLPMIRYRRSPLSSAISLVLIFNTPLIALMRRVVHRDCWAAGRSRCDTTKSSHARLNQE